MRPTEVAREFKLTTPRIYQIGKELGWSPSSAAKGSRGRPSCDAVAHLAERNRLIREDRTSGKTLQEIANIWGLTRERVRQIAKLQQIGAR